MPKKIAYILIALLALGIFVIVLVRSTYDTSFLTFEDNGAPEEPLVLPAAAASAPAAEDVVPPGPIPDLPMPRLSIPSIKVDAYIETVGLTGIGNVGTPKKLADVAWYKYGPKPGELGSAVIDGHVENSLGLPGVFAHLKDVQKNDDIYVSDSSGARLHFVVTDVSDYPLDTAPAEAIFHDQSDHILRLITCEKTLADGKYHYDHRVVVTAVLTYN